MCLCKDDGYGVYFSKESEEGMRKLFGILGFLFLGLGAIGIVLPLLPTTPFFILSAFCFAKSSKKLNDWFLSTSLYKKHLNSFVKDKTLTIKAKISILSSITVLMSICFLLMKHVPVGRLIIVIVWICHVLYFLFRVRTTTAKDTINCKSSTLQDL